MVPRSRLSRWRLPGLLALAALWLCPAASADDAPGTRAWQRCAVCHGEDGAGRADGTFPKIAGQYASVIRAQLAAIREGARPNPVMKPHVDAISDARDLADVATFVESMPRNANCTAEPGDDPERGEQLYRSGCASCHGEDGQGNAAEKIPWIACQYPAYLLRRVRQQASWGPTRHPETKPPLAQWSDAELRAVVDFAARLPATPATVGKGGAVRASAVGSAADPERPD